MDEQHSYSQYGYAGGEHDQMFESARMAPPSSSWGGQRGLPSLRTQSYLGAYPDHRPTPPSYRAPSMNFQRTISTTGLEHDHVSPLAPRSSIAHPNEAIQRYWHESDSPWTPIRSVSDGFSYTRNVAPAIHFPSPNLSPSYRQGPDSVESSDTGPSHSDSGYATAHTFSTVAMDPLDRPEYPENLSQRIGSLQIPPPHVNSHRPGEDRRSEPGHTYSRETSRTRRAHSMRRSTPEKCTHPGCGEVLKCPSDMKKHKLKHDKPFKCEVKGCKRTVGFTTVNDLNRHKKSVHKTIGTTKSFKCAAQHCKNRDKEWPRLDNFKQHVMRMHSDEDLDDIIKRSECRKSPRDSRSLSSTPQPNSMDRTLAGMDELSKHVHVNSSPSSGFSPDPNTKHYDPATTGVSTSTIFGDYSQRHGGYEHFGGGFRNPDANANELHFKVSPSRTESMSTGSSSGLNALAAAAVAEGNSIDNIPDPVSRTGHQVHAHNHHGTMEPRSERQRHKTTKPLALEITADPTSSNANEEVSEGRVLEIVTNATKANKLLHSTVSPQELTIRGPGDHTTPKHDDNDTETLDSLETISQADLKKYIAILSKRLKNKNKKRTSLTNTFSTERTKKCSFCDCAFSRSCDLKKHERRHKKPHGCTYPKCHKVFGSKSDWKRHENSQHFQAEVFRCQIKKITLSDVKRPSDVCGELLHKREDFQEHLHREHQLTDDAQIQTELKANRIGRNGQSKFWCGFCVDIVDLKQRRAAAWDERFNHIDHHFMKEGRKVDDWWCMEASMTKGEVRTKTDRHNFDDVDDDDDLERADGQELGRLLQARSPEAVMPGARTPTQRSPAVSLSPGQGSPSNKRKRLLDDHYVAGPRRPEIVMYCCRCGLGPYSKKLYMNCLQCEHEFCTCCGRKIVENRDGETEVDFDIEAHLE